MYRRFAYLLSLMCFLAACETDPYTMPTTQDQAVEIAKQRVAQEEKWGDKVEVMRVVHDTRG